MLLGLEVVQFVCRWPETDAILGLWHQSSWLLFRLYRSADPLACCLVWSACVLRCTNIWALRVRVVSCMSTAFAFFLQPDSLDTHSNWVNWLADAVAMAQTCRQTELFHTFCDSFSSQLQGIKPLHADICIGCFCCASQRRPRSHMLTYELQSFLNFVHGQICNSTVRLLDQCACLYRPLHSPMCLSNVCGDPVQW